MKRAIDGVGAYDHVHRTSLLASSGSTVKVCGMTSNSMLGG